MKYGRFPIATGCLLLLAACNPASDTATQPGNADGTAQAVKADGWITGAASDAERFAAIERDSRGFDITMWEVGERYRSIHAALERDNPELAAYHWDKIKTTIENGVIRRPKRGANASAMFLDPVWEDVKAGLASADGAQRWAAFERARTSCQGCHDAEKVGYMNNQPVFELRAPGQR